MISVNFTLDLKKLIEGDRKTSSRPIVVGKPSYVLAKCGAMPDQDITITKKVIDKAMRPETRDKNGRMIGNTGHGLTETLIVGAIMEMESPTMVFKGRQEDSLLVVTNIRDSKKRIVVVAIEFNREECFTKVNSIRSIYGRDNLSYFIGDNFKKGNLLAVNRKKADELLHSIGKSYPKENTFISYE